MTYTPPSRIRRARTHLLDRARRLERRAEPKRPSDVELRHLRTLQRAYGSRPGPEVLVIGDSIMYWTIREADRRRTFDMFTDELVADVRCLALSGAGYNARMVMAFLSAFSACPSRPRVVVVPLSLCTTMSSFLDHPVRGQARAAAAVRAAVGAWPDLPKSYEKATDEEWAAADQLTIPSLVGQHRTMGELDLIINAASSSPSQRVIRMRHLLDSYVGERLEPDTPGIQLVADMGRLVRHLNLRTVVYIPAVPHELSERLLGHGARQHIERNASVAASAFLESARAVGTVVNLAVAGPEAEFSDPIHFNHLGRHRLARAIAEAVDAQLSQSERARKAPVALVR
ncbi:MAG: hypothetical protein ACLPVF_06975 [Acidimicrobiales bacterium]